MLSRLENLASAVADFFFPQFCIGCGCEGGVICSNCLDLLPRLNEPYCQRCGLPGLETAPCRDCGSLDLAIDGIRSPLVFEKLSREAVHQLKYHNIRVMAKPLAGMLYDYLNSKPIPADVLVPVPLHPRRLKERGYNQSLLLALELGRLNNIPVDSTTLHRNIYTPPQARTANSAERHRNMSQAFTCLDGKLNGKKVLLIDDVSTSGATLNACAAALKTAGVASVWGLAVAREV